MARVVPHESVHLEGRPLEVPGTRGRQRASSPQCSDRGGVYALACNAGLRKLVTSSAANPLAKTRREQLGGCHLEFDFAVGEGK